MFVFYLLLLLIVLLFFLFCYCLFYLSCWKLSNIWFYFIHTSSTIIRCGSIVFIICLFINSSITDMYNVFIILVIVFLLSLYISTKFNPLFIGTCMSPNFNLIKWDLLFFKRSCEKYSKRGYYLRSLDYALYYKRSSLHIRVHHLTLRLDMLLNRYAIFLRSNSNDILPWYGETKEVFISHDFHMRLVEEIICCSTELIKVYRRWIIYGCSK